MKRDDAAHVFHVDPDQLPLSNAHQPNTAGRAHRPVPAERKTIDAVKPSLLIPFERDVDHFVGREDTISRVEQLLTKHSRVALVGMSGVGYDI